MSSGQTALITGGAGGIGFAVGEELLKRGVKICLVDLSADTLRKARANITAGDDKVMTVAVRS